MTIAELRFIEQAIWCRTPYAPDFIDELKRTIPFPYRRWDAGHKVWIIDTIFEDELVDLCEEHFGEVRITRPDANERARPNASHYSTLYLTPDAPGPVIDAAYRTLAKLWHPDINDDQQASERMKAVNIAYQRIKQERS